MIHPNIFTILIPVIVTCSGRTALSAAYCIPKFDALSNSGSREPNSAKKDVIPSEDCHSLANDNLSRGTLRLLVDGGTGKCPALNTKSAA